MKRIKISETIILDDEVYNILRQKGLITEEIIVDSLFNEVVESVLNIDKLAQEYLELLLSVRKLMKLSKSELLEYKILKILDRNGDTVRLPTLTDQLNYVRARIYQALKSLQKKRFVENVERGVYILTEAGRSYLQAEANDK